MHQLAEAALAERGVPERERALFAECCREAPAERPRDGAALVARVAASGVSGPG